VFAYLAFGLSIHSELELPELPVGDGKLDLAIRFGDVPENLPNPAAKGARFQATSSHLILRVDGHGRYLAKNGREVIIALDPAADPDAIRLFLLSSVMGAILHQRGILALHASAVEIHGCAVIFMGHSGAGKSTIAAALAKRGHRILSDEIAAVTVRDGKHHVLPGWPQLNIWTDVADTLGYKLANLRRVRPGLEKYGLPMGDRYCDAPLCLARIYILSSINTPEFKTDRLKGVAKLTAIVGQTYRPSFLGEGDTARRHFYLCAAVAQAVSVHKLVRPQVPLRLTELVDLVEGESSP
jgi:hypothetical protein